MKKKFLKICMLMGLTLSLAACGGNTTTETNESNSKDTEQVKADDSQEAADVSTEDGESVFSVAIDYMPEKLHSSFGTDSVTVITTPIYDPLFWDTQDGLEYRLAEDLEVSDDGLVYTIHLKKDAVWSDGEPITAEDVDFSVEYSAVRGGGVSDFTTSSVSGQPIERKIIDDKTIEFTLPVPNNYFHVSLGSMNVIPSHPFDGDAEAADKSDYFSKAGMATSGAYEVSEVNIDSLVYTARDNYYRGKANTDKVIMRVMGADANRKVAFESGEISYTRITNAQDLEKYKSESDKYNIVNFPEGRLNYLQINPYGPVMSELSDEARTAIFMALDQQEIIDAVYGSNELAEIANSIIVPECYDYNSNNPFYEHNIEEAQKLADKSGLTGKTLTYVYNKDRAAMEEVAIVVQQQLSRIGVNIQIQALDSPTFFPKFFMAWNDNAEEQATWDLGTNGWDSQRGTRNYSYSYLAKPEKWGWSEEAKELVTEYNSEPDLETRKDLGFKVQEQATKEAWLYPLPYPNFVAVTNKNVTNLDTTHIVPEFGDYAAIEVK